MSWVKLDDAFFRNPKVTAVQPLGRLLYMAGLCYCADTLTDGEIYSRDLPVLYHQSGASQKHVGQLVDAALWVVHADSFWVPDYLAYNPSREQVLKVREGARKRKESQRDRQRDSRCEFADPLPRPPSNSFTDYENNTGQERFAVKPPADLKTKLRAV